MLRPGLKCIVGSALVIGVCATAADLRANPYLTTVCQGPAGSLPYDGWFSIPNQSSLGTAEDLCRAFGPAAVSVFQIFPQDSGGTSAPREYQYICPVGSLPGTCVPLGASPSPSEPGCATSACFCIDDGEGFAVDVTTASSFTVDGCYTAFTRSLAASSSFLMSVAPDAGLATLDGLALALNLTRTGLNRGTVTRLDCTTGVTATVQAGSTAAMAAAFVPGEAYRVRNPSAFTYTNPISGAACGCTETALYDITGTGTGTDYAWWLDSFKDGVYAATEFSDPSVTGEPVGASAGDLATNLVNSINAVIGGAPCSATLVSYSPARISITCTPCSFDLYVAPATAGVPPFTGQCPVVTSSCTYNPTIRKVYASDDAGDVGDTLIVEPGAGGDLNLSWGASCVPADNDYEVYEGTIGSWNSHVPRACSTGGATSASLTPQAADSYYLVVPRNALYEGLYGRTSAGASRPQSAAACTVQQASPACP